MNGERRKQLVEQYENAAMELLMDEYAQADGESLWQDYCAVQSRGDAPEIPEALDQACMRGIRAYFEKEKRHARLKQTMRRICIAACVSILLVAASATLVMSVEALRVPTLNYLLTHFDSFAMLSFSEEAKGWVEDNERIMESIGHLIPDGYEVELDSPSYYGSVCLVYKNDQGHIISFVAVSMDGSLSVNTENAEVETVIINGYPGMYIEYIEKDSCQVVWSNVEQKRTYCLYASALDSKLLWQIVYALAV